MLPVDTTQSFCQKCNTLYTSGFVDDVTFSPNGKNWQESDDAYVSSISPGGGTGSEVCRLRLHIVLVYIAIISLA